MIPILVVDNSRRVVCRGHFHQDGPRIKAHLRFEDLVPATELDAVQARAARTVADINNQVRRRLEAHSRRVQRRVVLVAFLAGAKVVGVVLGLLTLAWFLLFGVIWAIAAAFGFSL